MIGRIADPSLWRAGADRIDWARAHMPVTVVLAERLRRAGTVAGVRIGVSDVLEPKTAAVALALAEAGAEVTVTSAGRNTDDEVAAALAHAGLAVYARADAGRSEDRENALALLDHRPEVIVDDGASTIRLVHLERPDVGAEMRGATEQTTSGVRPLRRMHAEGALRIPVIAANDARSKSLFDNRHGTGQSVVFAVADVANRSLRGATVVVVGYGRVGSGIAEHAAALGARVIVTETDPVAALQAAFAGFPVRTLAQAAAEADIVISATGIRHTVDVAHLDALPSGAIVAVGGGVSQEIALDAARAAGAIEIARDGAVSTLRMSSGSLVHVLDDGNCLNVSAAEGNPVQIMDLSFGVQLASVEYLLTTPGLGAAVHELPRGADDEVAAIALASFGGTVDTVSAAQREFLASWIAAEGDDE
ncbi:MULTISPECIES: adenosylhomocysteinase [Microbacterium]|uniref:adenosylhomocysteinase n=1 Tax=Microbacterium TaxID=33882 RepID=UPI00277DED71|nr:MULTISPECIES: adenosylhomocysteinase [Microbacterium]MDQ1075780.1 adenosylhomocysteinase [Microbacterium sp. SORGH_AS_0969]MDQ1116023.1 adenosylhomocysteinase [Microbacterium testaceum]